MNGIDEAMTLAIIKACRLEQYFRKRADRGHRRAHLVADLAQEVVLLPIQFTQPGIGFLQLLRCYPQFR